MGTNYYLRHKPCPICGSIKNEIHIGKSSCGWQFDFRGYKSENIVSYKDWLEEFNNEKKEIVDEYGIIVPLEEFRYCVERHERKEMLNHSNIAHRVPQNDKEKKYMKEHTAPYYNAELYWKDNEGYSFYGGGFS